MDDVPKHPLELEAELFENGSKVDNPSNPIPPTSANSSLPVSGFSSPSMFSSRPTSSAASADISSVDDVFAALKSSRSAIPDAAPAYAQSSTNEESMFGTIDPASILSSPPPPTHTHPRAASDNPSYSHPNRNEDELRTPSIEKQHHRRHRHSRQSDTSFQPTSTPTQKIIASGSATAAATLVARPRAVDSAPAAEISTNTKFTSPPPFRRPAESSFSSFDGDETSRDSRGRSSANVSEESSILSFTTLISTLVDKKRPSDKEREKFLEPQLLQLLVHSLIEVSPSHPAWDAVESGSGSGSSSTTTTTTTTTTGLTLAEAVCQLVLSVFSFRSKAISSVIFAVINQNAGARKAIGSNQKVMDFLKNTFENRKSNLGVRQLCLRLWAVSSPDVSEAGAYFRSILHSAKIELDESLSSSKKKKKSPFVFGSLTTDILLALISLPWDPFSIHSVEDVIWILKTPPSLSAALSCLSLLLRSSASIVLPRISSLMGRFPTIGSDLWNDSPLIVSSWVELIVSFASDPEMMEPLALECSRIAEYHSYPNVSMNAFLSLSSLNFLDRESEIWSIMSERIRFWSESCGARPLVVLPLIESIRFALERICDSYPERSRRVGSALYQWMISERVLDWVIDVASSPSSVVRIRAFQTLLWAVSPQTGKGCDAGVVSAAWSALIKTLQSDNHPQPSSSSLSSTSSQSNSSTHICPALLCWCWESTLDQFKKRVIADLFWISTDGGILDMLREWIRSAIRFSSFRVSLTLPHLFDLISFFFDEIASQKRSHPPRVDSATEGEILESLAKFLIWCADIEKSDDVIRAEINENGENEKTVNMLRTRCSKFAKVALDVLGVYAASRYISFNRITFEMGTRGVEIIKRLIEDFLTNANVIIRRSASLALTRIALSLCLRKNQPESEVGIEMTKWFRLGVLSDRVGDGDFEVRKCRRICDRILELEVGSIALNESSFLHEQCANLKVE